MQPFIRKLKHCIISVILNIVSCFTTGDSTFDQSSNNSGWECKKPEKPSKTLLVSPKVIHIAWVLSSVSLVLPLLNFNTKPWQYYVLFLYNFVQVKKILYNPPNPTKPFLLCACSNITLLYFTCTKLYKKST